MAHPPSSTSRGQSGLEARALDWKAHPEGRKAFQEKGKALKREGRMSAAMDPQI